MTQDFTGRVLFANGRSAAGVRIRVFDKDAPGKADDDLTVEEGLSDASGRFTVRFSPSKFLDFREISTEGLFNLPFDWTVETRIRRLPDLTDLYLPYLEFQYTFNGQPRSHSAFLRPFKHEFRLPEVTPLAFQPTLHGYRFVNRFSGYFIPFSVPALPDIPSANNIYGLCGGMCASAYDFALAGRPIPPDEKAPKRAGPLHQYIYRRQNDSLGTFGDQVVRFARWMALPDDTPLGVWKKTADEFEKLRALLDDGIPSPIGLVYVSARDTLQIWQNHQVLAYGYSERDDGKLDVHIYDPNHPLRDDVVVRCQRVSISDADSQTTLPGLDGAQFVGDRRKKVVRGFFVMPYVPVEPPSEL